MVKPVLRALLGRRRGGRRRGTSVGPPIPEIGRNRLSTGTRRETWSTNIRGNTSFLARNARTSGIVRIANTRGLFAAFESTATLALIFPTTARASDPSGSWSDFATGTATVTGTVVHMRRHDGGHLGIRMKRCPSFAECRVVTTKNTGRGIIERLGGTVNISPKRG